MNRIGTLLTIAAAISALSGCVAEKRGAFLKNMGGVDGIVASLKGATKEIDEPQELEMGRGMAETLLGARPLLNDADLQRYVNEVGAWVVTHTERPHLPWRFAVNDSSHVNAFAAPGGYIIVTKGMIDLMENEAELAAVLAHEVAHVTRKHHLKALKKEALQKMLAAGVSASATGTRNQQMVDALVGPTQELYARGLDKQDEFEADRVGLVIAARAGYDPWAMVAMMQKLDRIKADDPHLALLFKTHPSPEMRLEKLGVAMGSRFDSMTKGAINAERFLAATRRVTLAKK